MGEMKNKKILWYHKFLKNSGLLVKSITQTIKNEADEQRSWFLSMLLSRVYTDLYINNLYIINW